MSLDAGISLELKKFQTMDIIECYIKSGLEIYNSQQQVYIITSNDDSYDWNYRSVTYDELNNIISYRQEHSLPIGISFYENGVRITNLLVVFPNKIIFNCDINRKTIELANNENYTDVNWYIENLVMPLIRNNYCISHLEYWEAK